MANQNGYVVYPCSIGVMFLQEAMELAADASKEGPNYCARVEDCDTERIVAQYRDGEEVIE